MQLYSEECLIMNFKGSIEPKDNPSITLYKAVDYNLNLQFSLEKEEKQGSNERITVRTIYPYQVQIPDQTACKYPITKSGIYTL